MLDIKWIRSNKQAFEDFLIKRNIKFSYDEIITLDEENRNLQTITQSLTHAKNLKSQQLVNLNSNSAVLFEEITRDINDINDKLKEIELKTKDNARFIEILHNLPNILDDEVPIGSNESMNKFISEYKSERQIFNDAMPHFEIGTKLGMMDFEQTAKISGSRFVTLKGNIARLERALINFMIDFHVTNNNFTEISVPSLVKNETMFNSGQLPKFHDASYLIQDKNLRLIPTSEVPITNMVAGKILSEDELPIHYVGYTPCYRSESGSAGKDTRGMIRNHQFGKVELISITKSVDSKKAHENMLNSAESILKQLDLSYRVMLLCSGDTGFSASKTYDIEVWLPSQRKYREISSISNCLDFQARRMKARYRSLQEKENKFVHTLNGSGLAVGRTIVAILENYQNADGSVTIPNVLVPYMGGINKIELIK